MKLNKISFKIGLLLAVAGACFVVFGVNLNFQSIRLAGYIIFTGGAVAMAKRLYETIQEKAKQKKVDNKLKGSYI